MNFHAEPKLWRLRISPLVLFVLSLAACGKDEMRWKEEVYLHDGSLVQVDRDAIRNSSGFPNARRGAILSEELRYAPLKVVWQAAGSGEVLLSFDIVDGIPYVVSTTTVNKSHFCAGRPTGDYIGNYYRWIDGKRERISKGQTPIAVMRNNVSGISHWGFDRDSDPTYLSWHDVMENNHQSGTPMLLSQLFTDYRWLRCN